MAWRVTCCKITQQFCEHTIVIPANKTVELHQQRLISLSLLNSARHFYGCYVPCSRIHFGSWNDLVSAPFKVSHPFVCEDISH